MLLSGRHVLVTEVHQDNDDTHCSAQRRAFQAGRTQHQLGGTEGVLLCGNDHAVIESERTRLLGEAEEVAQHVIGTALLHLGELFVEAFLEVGTGRDEARCHRLSDTPRDVRKPRIAPRGGDFGG